MSDSIIIVKPFAVTPAALTSNVAETDTWNAAAAYTVGQQVTRATTHKIYERLIAGTTATIPESDATNWIEVSASNRWKMFDNVVMTKTVNAGSIVVTIEIGRIVNAVSLLSVVADTVQVKMTDAIEGVVFDRTIDLFAPPYESTGFSWAFDPIEYKTSAIFTDLPAYASAEIEITLTVATGDAECGVCIVGEQRSFGLGVQAGARIGITDYSRKETDDFGNVSVVQRAFSKRAAIESIVPNNQIDFLQTLLAEIRGTPAVFVGSSGFESLQIYGFYKGFDVTISYSNYSQLQLEIEGLI